MNSTHTHTDAKLRVTHIITHNCVEKALKKTTCPSIPSRFAFSITIIFTRHRQSRSFRRLFLSPHMTSNQEMRISLLIELVRNGFALMADVSCFSSRKKMFVTPCFSVTDVCRLQQLLLHNHINMRLKSFMMLVLHVQSFNYKPDDCFLLLRRCSL